MIDAKDKDCKHKCLDKHRPDTVLTTRYIYNNYIQLRNYTENNYKYCNGSARLLHIKKGEKHELYTFRDNHTT